MSRAFMKESAEAAPPPERMLSDGPVLVTEAGFAHIASEVARLEHALARESNVLLRETMERDLRFWRAAQGRAETVRPPAPGSAAFGSVAFATTATIERRAAPDFAPRRLALTIVGEVESDPARGRISVRSPLAQSLLGARAGDVVETQTPKAEILVVAVG